MNVRALIQKRRKDLGLTQAELAIRTNIPRGTLSRIENDKENVTLATLNRIIETGLSSRLNLSLEGSVPERAAEKRKLLRLIKKNGGLWSYDMVRSDLPYDDVIVENALLHLELEEMHFLFEVYDHAYIRQVWEERMLSQGKRLNSLNLVLALTVFNVPNAKQFIDSYGNNPAPHHSKRPRQ